MRGSRPSLFMIIPNTTRHPNNTKTDQLRISEVITGLRTITFVRGWLWAFVTVLWVVTIYLMTFFFVFFCHRPRSGIVRRTTYGWWRQVTLLFFNTRSTTSSVCFLRHGDPLCYFFGVLHFVRYTYRPRAGIVPRIYCCTAVVLLYSCVAVVLLSYTNCGFMGC